MCINRQKNFTWRITLSRDRRFDGTLRTAPKGGRCWQGISWQFFKTSRSFANGIKVSLKLLLTTFISPFVAPSTNSLEMRWTLPTLKDCHDIPTHLLMLSSPCMMPNISSNCKIIYYLDNLYIYMGRSNVNNLTTKIPNSPLIWLSIFYIPHVFVRTYRIGRMNSDRNLL